MAEEKKNIKKMSVHAKKKARMKAETRIGYEYQMSQLSNKSISFFPTTDGSSCWFSGVVLPEGTELNTAKEICEEMKKADIEARSFWKPVHLQKPYRDCPRSSVEVAEGLWQRRYHRRAGRHHRPVLRGRRRGLGL